MFGTLGEVIFRARWWVVLLAVLGAPVAAAWGAGSFTELVDGGFTYADSESSQADDLAQDTIGRNAGDVVVLFSSDRWTVDDPEFDQAVSQVLGGLPDEVDGVIDFWSSGVEQLVSADRHATYAAIQVEGADDQERSDNYGPVKEALTSSELDLQVGGSLATFDDVKEQSEDDLSSAEALALPILFVVLVLIYRNFLAACLTVLGGGLAIVGSLAALRSLNLVTDVSIFAINIVTLLGLGLAIDYSLFIVYRFREERAKGHAQAEAVRRTMMTAGRTVAVSAVTVGIALSSLLLFPQVFLRSIGLGGLAAVTLAAVFALTVLPATLAILGNRVGGWRDEDRAAPDRRGAWERIAHAVMERPVLIAGSVVALLLIVGLPFLRISYGWLDTRVLPEGAESRQVQETIEQDFQDDITRPIEAIVTLAEPVESAGGQAALDDYVTRVGDVPGIDLAIVNGAEGTTARVTAIFSVEPISEGGRSLVEAVRSVPPPAGGEVLVGGDSAKFADLMDMLTDRLPWMALFVTVTTFVLLFLAFGSFVLPIKALFLNMLSLTAAFGAVVLIFQDGNLTGLLDFTSTGNIDVVQPILILAIAFGLSMDYEVFLLSRVREQYDLTGDNRDAVATGLQRTGRIITSAALLLVIVIGSFATSGVLVVKIVGIGLALAIIVDATIVRALLMPATMRLLGRHNWWAPRWAGRLYSRWGLHERGELDEPLDQSREPEVTIRQRG